MPAPDSPAPVSAHLLTASATPIASDGPGISAASHRLRALAALSGSLTDALEPEDAAHLVEQKALSALGATSAIVVTLGPFPPEPSTVHPIAEHAVGERPADGHPPTGQGAVEQAAAEHAAAGHPPTHHPAEGATLTVLHAIGLPREVSASLEQLPLDAPVPMAEVARMGEPLFLASETEMRRYPDWSEAMIGAGARSAAIVPVWANGELRGVLGLSWAAPHVFDDDERAFVLTLGVMCAQAIMRAHLRAAERGAREIAEDANRSKSQFLTMISHELRTPMNAVLGYTALMAEEVDGPVSEMQRDHLGRVRASGQHLLGLIEELLDFARVEAGGEVARLEPVSLVSVVRQSIVLVAPIAEARGLKVRVEEPETPLELYTDPGKLRQILVNLLANAVKFTDEGDVSLILRVEGVRDEMMVHFIVTDTGRGISEADQAHVFDAYWRKDTGAPAESRGTGLGLPVARQLARLLGGDVVLAGSIPGKGSTFILSLPARYRGPIKPDKAPTAR